MENTNGTTWMETPAGKHLQETLSNQKTLSSIDRLLHRIDTLEKAVEKLTVVIEQGPGLMSITMDAIDEEVKRSADRGVDINQRLGAALEIAEKLTAPAMVEKLDALLSIADQAPGLMSITMDAIDEGAKRSADRGVDINQRLGAALDIAEKLTAPAMVEKLDALLSIADQAPGLMSITMDAIDEGAKRSADRGVDINQRLGAALEIAEKLTAPAMVEKLDAMLSLADQAPGLISITMDAVDEGVRHSAEKGVDINERISNALLLAEKFTAPDMVEKMEGMLKLADMAPGLIAMTMDMVDDGVKSIQNSDLATIDMDKMNLKTLVEVAEMTGIALSEAKEMPREKVSGIFSMLRIMKDPDRQKAIGFVMSVAKAWGRQMK
ncbi:MAG TPA: DUF1641 domain-containing protein [Phaeodactylibacter sp.]|nr:DUF1641 domain-containing protein [Phaeodactylibacter sp.]